MYFGDADYTQDDGYITNYNVKHNDDGDDVTDIRRKQEPYIN